mmetsp:Transcript_6444/g.20054  ORF Transcript_6444/g.20054 Transcript_6444/m.20054 type:complete len:240 (+) Transcript_6444:302-1021(+)
MRTLGRRRTWPCWRTRWHGLCCWTWWSSLQPSGAAERRSRRTAGSASWGPRLEPSRAPAPSRRHPRARRPCAPSRRTPKVPQRSGPRARCPRRTRSSRGQPSAVLARPVQPPGRRRRRWQPSPRRMPAWTRTPPFWTRPWLHWKTQLACDSSKGTWAWRCSCCGGAGRGSASWATKRGRLLCWASSWRCSWSRRTWSRPWRSPRRPWSSAASWAARGGRRLPGLRCPRSPCSKGCATRP